VLKLISQFGTLEGKLHLPSLHATSLLIFQPGFPGGGATDFEKLHVRELTKAGHAVFTTRHNGTIFHRASFW
jgi:hypothetical protein